MNKIPNTSDSALDGSSARERRGRQRKALRRWVSAAAVASALAVASATVATPWAVVAGASDAPAPVITAVTPGTAPANDWVTILGSGFGPSQGNGYVTLKDMGHVFGSPAAPAPLQIISWSDAQVVFNMPARSGADNENTLQLDSVASITVTDSTGTISNAGSVNVPGPYFANAGRDIVDTLTGDVVHLHGVDISGLEQGEGTAATPPTCSQSSDAGYGCYWVPSTAQINAAHDMEFNVVRLPITWADLEPNAPVNGIHTYNQAYLDQVKNTVMLLANEGIPVILSMHQWGWSPLFLINRAGPGATPSCAHGGGMPAWLYGPEIGYNRVCGDPGELAAQNNADKEFFGEAFNGQPATDPHSLTGQEQSFVAVEQYIASQFVGNPGVTGIDVLNEPPAGIDPTRLETLYSALGTEDRIVNPDISLVFEDEAMLQPVITSVPAIGNTNASLDNEIYSWHIYPSCWSTTSTCTRNGFTPVSEHLARAEELNIPLWIGEFDYIAQVPQPAGSKCIVPDTSQTSAMLQFFHDNDIQWSYWALNGGTAKPLMNNPCGTQMVQLMQQYF